MIQYWKFRVQHKTKFLAGKIIRVECGKLEEKLMEIIKEGWDISQLYDFQLITVK